MTADQVEIWSGSRKWNLKRARRTLFRHTSIASQSVRSLIAPTMCTCALYGTRRTRSLLWSLPLNFIAGSVKGSTKNYNFKSKFCSLYQGLDANVRSSKLLNYPSTIARLLRDCSGLDDLRSSLLIAKQTIENI